MQVARRGAVLLIATILIAGCASNTKANPPKDSFLAIAQHWTGRISLQVQGTPDGVVPQSFSASFELSGQPERGTLTLISPLGNVLGVLRWVPDEAVLDSGSGKLQRFSSVEAFMAQNTGAAVPMTALFGWLRGDDTPIPGWTADLSRWSEGRIAARRNQPAPQADLRVVLDR
jgi:outer membrane lipoprotein LolB